MSITQKIYVLTFTKFLILLMSFLNLNLGSTTDECSLLTLRSKGGWALKYSLKDGEELLDWSPMIQGYDEVRDTTFYEDATFPRCKVQVCHDLGKIVAPQYRFACSKLTTDHITYMTDRNYRLIGLRCSCQPNSTFQCWRTTDACPDKVEESDSMGCHLYAGVHCDTCQHGYVGMLNGTKFMPTFQFRAVALKAKCLLTHKWTEETSAQKNQVYTIQYNQSMNNIQETWKVNSADSVIECSCQDFEDDNGDTMTTTEKIPPPPTTPRPYEISSLKKYLVQIIASSLGILFLAFLTFYLIKSKLSFKKSIKASENEEIELSRVPIKGKNNSSKDLVNNQDKIELPNSAPSSSSITSSAPATFEMKILDQVLQAIQNYQPMREIKENELELPNNDLLENELGKGAYGVVIRGILTTTSDAQKIEIRNVAVKKVKPNVFDPDYFRAIGEELKILCYIGLHANIIELIGYFTGDFKSAKLFLVFELASNDSISKYVQRKLQENNTQITINEASSQYCRLETIPLTKSPIPITQLLLWAVQIATGLEFLHFKSVIHRDLAARNILLTEDLIAKICDFGLARQVDPATQLYTQNSNNPVACKWVALESLKTNSYTLHGDIWSFGITLWEIFNLAGDEEPYSDIPSTDLELLFQRLSSPESFRLEMPLHATEEIYNTILQCWLEDPSSRPTAIKLKLYFDRAIIDMA